LENREGKVLFQSSLKSKCIGLSLRMLFSSCGNVLIATVTQFWDTDGLWP